MDWAQKQRNPRIQKLVKNVFQTIEPKKLDIRERSLCGTVQLPASKSISNRALIINALSGNTCHIHNLAKCDDTDVLQRALNNHTGRIDIGAAGTAMRFLTAFFALQSGKVTLTGSERMCQRPIGALVDALRTLGAHISYLGNNGFPPLLIDGGHLHGGELTPHFGQSSQFFSAIMMIAPCLEGGLTLHLTQNVSSVAYIRMTANMMQQFGATVLFDSDKIDIPEGHYAATDFTIENDWSAASYWYELLAIAQHGHITLPHLSVNSLQGDAKIANAFAKFGITTTFTDNCVEIEAQQLCAPDHFEHNFSDMPDMAQTFAVMCCARNVPFHFTGLKTLKIKETDRILALQNELRKCGYILTEPAEGELAWHGVTCARTTTPRISTYHDHRMAMAFAPLAAIMPVEIENPEVVTKSYPTFWQEWDKITSR